MAYGMNVAEYVRRTGRQPDRLFNQEVKQERKISNRKWRKRPARLLKNRDLDWEAVALPPPPKTEGWLTT